MQYIGRRLYYDKANGNILVVIPERSGYFFDTTIEQDFAAYTALSARDPETVGILELEYGLHAEDFAACDGFRVDPLTEALEFSFPSDPGGEQPVFQKPLSEQVAELKADKAVLENRVQVTEDAIVALMDTILLA